MFANIIPNDLLSKGLLGQNVLGGLSHKSLKWHI